MDNEVDQSPVIYQQLMTFLEGDTSLEVYRKIIVPEKKLPSKNFANLAFGNYQIITLLSDEDHININDFNTPDEINIQIPDIIKKHLNTLTCKLDNICASG
ncbi:hypothetical protein [Phytobacter sp. V91]|uniref:hypothetical protein n=1 Tax=Phytobacter sp. V91 TaxID=3369425 RepID=UPI003F621987